MADIIAVAWMILASVIMTKTEADWDEGNR